jgi:uncharacterized protein (DUF1684 family)
MMMSQLIKKFSILILLLIPSVVGYSQGNEDSTTNRYAEDISKYRNGRNIKMLYDEATPLLPEQLKNFKGLKYFEPELRFKVEGKLVKDQSPEIVLMKTSSDREPAYIRYGVVYFKIDTFNLKLAVFQNKKMLDLLQDTSQLFVPFRDGSTGMESYGGGRYIDCEIPLSGENIEIDFNKAYNPYCAYNPRFSCVIPPEENRMVIRIEAGEKIFEEH